MGLVHGGDSGPSLCGVTNVAGTRVCTSSSEVLRIPCIFHLLDGTLVAGVPPPLTSCLISSDDTLPLGATCNLW